MRRAIVISLLLGAAQPALAQIVQSKATPAQPATVQRPVVQPIPGGESQALNAALARLGKDPRDVGALIDAGNAALAMGDVDAAVGFFARADQLAPNSPRVRAGLAGALVQSGNPYDAIPLFAEAEAAGGMDPKLNSERGLAYDLVGDNATAQRYYLQALSAGPSDEISRRLALSEAIAGDRAAMEGTLAPLIQRGDKGAQRIRAFGLAILGRPDEAVLIAQQSMPADLAAGIAPYLRYMPRLTKAQQASAAMFGHFPRAADIGRDDPRVARYAPPVRVATADVGLVPNGTPLGGKAKAKPATEPAPKSGEAKGKPQVAAAAPRIAPPDLQPSREESVAPAGVTELSPIGPPPARSALPQQVAAAKPAPNKPASKPVQAAPTPAFPAQQPVKVAANSFDLGQMGKPAATTPPPPAPQPVARPVVPPPAPVAQPARPKSFADAFGDLGAPEAKPVAASGAVDLRKIQPARPKPVEPPNPSRIWVQVGVGRAKAQLGFTWRGLVKDYPDLFRGKSASISEWGRTNRLLTGPFETERAADSFLAKLKREELDAFVWTSPAGQVVDPLPTR